MKRLMTMLACAVAVCTASAWTIELDGADTNAMILPPVVDFSVSWAQVKERAITNETIQAGEYRRIGRSVLVAANDGSTTNTLVTTTHYITNGVWLTEAPSGYTGAVITNTVTKIAPIAVPQTGLTVADGSVYWCKVPSSRESVIVQPTLSTAAVVTFSNAESGGDGFTASTSGTRIELRGYTGALWAAADSNDCSVAVFAW